MLMSDILDLADLSRRIGIPILEMEDLKGPSIAQNSFKKGKISPGPGGAEGIEDNEWETIGCWGLLQTSQNNTECNTGNELSSEAGRIREQSLLAMKDTD